MQTQDQTLPLSRGVPWPHPTSQGWHFRLYAPHAKGVSLLGDFSHWTDLPMDQLQPGLWHLCLPHARAGQAYQFNITTADGTVLRKSDPCGPGRQKPPYHGSVLCNTHYPWQDAPWMTWRKSQLPGASPLLIYGMDLDSWRRDRTGGRLPLSQIAGELIPHVKQLGATHIQLSRLFGGDNPHAPDNLFAPSPLLGTLEELFQLVNALHRAGIGVLLQFPLGGFSDNAFGLDRLDGQPVFEGNTPLRYDFSRFHTQQLLMGAATFWAEVCHMDGLVLPDGDYLTSPGCQDFLQLLNRQLHEIHPGFLTILQGEPSPALGFDLCHGPGWQDCVLDYHHLDPLFRGGHHSRLVRLTEAAQGRPCILPLSPEGCRQTSLVEYGFGQGLPQKLSAVRTLYLYQLTQPGGKLLSMGSEFSQLQFPHPDRSLDWHLLQNPQHRQQLDFFRAAGQLYLAFPALWRGDYRWLVREDATGNTLVYLRTDPAGGTLLVALNFSGLEYRSVCVGVPQQGAWQVLLSTDHPDWGGHGKSSGGTLSSVAIPHQGMQQSLFLDLSPMSGVVLLQPTTGE